MATADGARRIHVVLGGPTSERQVSRQSGCFVGLSLLASGSDVRFFLMDLQSRYTEIGLFYVLHHDVEEIQALVGDPVRRADDRGGRGRRAGRLRHGGGGRPERPCGSGTPFAWRTWPADADFVFLALHGGPGEDGRSAAGPRPARDAATTAPGRVRSAVAGDKCGHRGPGAGPRACPESRRRPSARSTSSSWGPGWTRWPARVPRRPATPRCATSCRARALVCKPATDGCSTGVKLLRRPEVMERFFAAIVAEAPEFAT